MLTFTCQKNGIKIEVYWLGYSDNPFLCPVLALPQCTTNNTPDIGPDVIWAPRGHFFFCTYLLCQAVTFLGMGSGFSLLKLVLFSSVWLGPWPF